MVTWSSVIAACDDIRISKFFTSSVQYFWTPPSSMDKLTPIQAQALFEAGGFVIISGLAQGSEFGIDGK